MNQTNQLIAAAESQARAVPWMEFRLWAAAEASKLEVQATGELRWLLPTEVEVDYGKGVMVETELTLYEQCPISSEAIALAGSGWGLMQRLNRDKLTVEETIERAQTEYARASAYHYMLMAGGVAVGGQEKGYAEQAAIIVSLSRTFDLCDGRACMSRPLYVPWGLDHGGSARSLLLWLLREHLEGANSDDDCAPVGLLQARQVMAAASVAWMDVSPEAEPDDESKLFAMAGHALAMDAELDEWEAAGRARTTGSLGGAKRHELTRLLKQWALAQAAHHKGPDKEIAKALVNRVPEHLRSASGDPQRLIYDALRASRRTKQQRSG